MGKRTTTNTLIIVFTFIIVVVTIIVLIQQVEANIFFWILRPSELVALDIAGTITALSGTTGNIMLDYTNETTGVRYNITNQNSKMICVIAVKQEEGLPAFKTINCQSLPLSVYIKDCSSAEDEEFVLHIEKGYDNGIDIKTWWKDPEGCKD